jgi:ketosteroid isomerase-like protein
VTQAEGDAAVEDRYEAARQVIRQIGLGRGWEDFVDPDMPSPLRELTFEMLDAYERLDLDWLMNACHPEIVITQPPEVPGGRTYHGREGLIEALIDWPRQWEEFHMVPRRIFAEGADHLLIDTVHHGRPHTVDIEVEAVVVFVLRFEDGLATRWQMFLSPDEALQAARAG